MPDAVTQALGDELLTFCFTLKVAGGVLVCLCRPAIVSTRRQCTPGQQQHRWTVSQWQTMHRCPLQHAPLQHIAQPSPQRCSGAVPPSPQLATPCRPPCSSSKRCPQGQRLHEQAPEAPRPATWAGARGHARASRAHWSVHQVGRPSRPRRSCLPASSSAARWQRYTVVLCMVMVDECPRTPRQCATDVTQRRACQEHGCSTGMIVPQTCVCVRVCHCAQPLCCCTEPCVGVDCQAPEDECPRHGCCSAAYRVHRQRQRIVARVHNECLCWYEFESVRVDQFICHSATIPRSMCACAGTRSL